MLGDAIVSKKHHHPSQSFRSWYNCEHGAKVSRQAKRMWLNAGKTQPRNWSLVVGPISRVLARPSTQAAPYNTAYATSYQATDLTILSEVPSSLLTHQTTDVFFLDLPCMWIVDAKMTAFGWEAIKIAICFRKSSDGLQILIFFVFHILLSVVHCINNQSIWGATGW